MKTKFFYLFLSVAFITINDSAIFGAYGKEDYMNKIKMTFDNQEVVIKVFEGKTSEDFLKQLPLILPFEDFGGIEKIAYLNQKLIVANEDSKGEKSDFCYYAPWGNLTVFYKEYGNAHGLVKIGYIQEGKEYLAKIKNDTKIKIEKL